MSSFKTKNNYPTQINLFELSETITANIGVGVYIVQQGKFVYTSPIYRKLTGYTEHELIGVNSLEYVHPEDKDKVRQQAIKCLKGESSDSYEYRYIKKNGEIMWILEMITSIVYHGKRAALGSFMDITARKHMEEALRQSEERYRTVIEDIEEGYYEVDLQGNFTFASDSICATLGYPREELIGMSYKNYVPNEQFDYVYNIFKKVYETGKPIKSYSLINIRKNGERIHVEDSVAPLSDKNGKIIGFKGITRDITQRKQMEEALRQSEEKYRNILQSIQEGYFELDLAGNYTFVNDANCRLLGYSREELTGMNYRQFQDENTAKKTRQIFSEVYKKEEPIQLLDVEIIRKNGSKAFNEISVSLLKDKQGKATGFRGISRDVTVRRQMEEMIRQSEEKYRTIINEVDEWYFEIDLAGNVIFVNDAIVRSVGYPPERLIGLNYKSFTSEERSGEVFKIFRQVYETREPIKNFPYEFVLPDGKITFFELSVFPKLDDQGKVVGFRGVGHDVTERKRTEEQLNYIATHDLLTGLPNRMLLMDRLKMATAQAKRNAQKLALMMLDLDNFKNVNDSLGHMVGDKLLKEISLRLTGRLRQNDTICRLGGDEFIILLPAIERVEDAVEVAKIILESFEQSFICNDHLINSSISIGIAIYPDDAQDIDVLMKNADMAMYYVKAHGRNGYHLFSYTNNKQFSQTIQ
jgi:diguanylate cyclase (GGDEF)-like protein/PAS domain S-box-containing protein